jgi:hypothetical protein
MRSQVQVLAGPPLFSQLRALPPPGRSHPLPAWAASGPHAPGQSRPRPSRSRPPSAQVMVGLMPAIMSLTTCGQPCRRCGRTSPRTRLPTDGRSLRNRLLMVGQAVEPGRGPRTSLRPRPSRRLRWPSMTCASFERQIPTRADDQPVVDTVRGDHADSGRPRRIGALHELTRFGHSRRGNARIADAGCPDARTPNWTPDTGHRTPTPDSGHPDAWTPTPDTGHRSRGHSHAWTLARVDTGRSHRVLDAGYCRGPDRLTRHGQLWISWTTTPPSGCPLGCRTVFLRTAPAALGVSCRLGGEASCQCAKLPIALSGSCSVASPAKRRLGALLSSDDYGSSVEREALGQVLWRVHLGAAAWRGPVTGLGLWHMLRLEVQKAQIRRLKG